MIDWKPIETAAKIRDVQILTVNLRPASLLWKGSPWWYQASFWSDQHQCWVGWPRDEQPSHWMPMPSPPFQPFEPRSDV